MDPNTPQPQGESDAVKKLEQDLQNLTQQTATVPPAVPETQPAQQTPQVPEVSPVVSPPLMPSAAPVETNIPTEESPKKGSPLMIIAIILAIVSVLAVVAYIFGAKLLSPKSTPTPIAVLTPFPTPEVTANWETYSNTKYGFAFRYPQNFSLTITSPGDQGVSFSPNSYKDLDFQNLPLVSFYVYVNTKNTPQEFINSLQKPGFSDIQNIESKTLGSYSAVQFDSRNLQAGSGGLDLNTVIQLSKTGFLMITLTNSEKGMVDTYSQILSTFKFIEATPAASPTASPSSTPMATP